MTVSCMLEKLGRSYLQHWFKLRKCSSDEFHLQLGGFQINGIKTLSGIKYSNHEFRTSYPVNGSCNGSAPDTLKLVSALVDKVSLRRATAELAMCLMSSSFAVLQ